MGLIKQALQLFEAIDLDELKAKAELMERLDNKYVLDEKNILEFLAEAKKTFLILDINGVRRFSYMSQYFDTVECKTFLDHNQGKRKRIKIRHREYVDSGKNYLEVKLKGRRQITKKFRVDVKPDKILNCGVLSEDLQGFCKDILCSNGYSDDFEYCHPSIAVGYERITLVSIVGEERITIDNKIRFLNAGQPESESVSLNDQRWIVEVKSSTGRSHMDRWMLKKGWRSIALCSKYCMGLNLMRYKNVNNRFSQVLRRRFVEAI